MEREKIAGTLPQISPPSTSRRATQKWGEIYLFSPSSHAGITRDYSTHAPKMEILYQRTIPGYVL